MKKSNRLLLYVAIAFVAGVLVTDGLLAKAYAEINFSDPYKNYQDVVVPSFKALHIKGGNGYSIQINQGKDLNVKVMNSRKGFLKTSSNGDTLFIEFAVANAPRPSATDKLPVGLIIACPDIVYLNLSGTNNQVGPMKLDSMHIVQDANTLTVFKQLDIDYLFLDGRQKSWFDFNEKNVIQQLKIQASADAGINLQGIVFNAISPLLRDNAKIVFFKQSLKNANNSGYAGRDSIR